MVAKKGLEYAKVLSVSPQLRAKDIKYAFTKKLKDVTVTYLAWHKEALLLVGDIPSVINQCGRQCSTANTPAEDSETYYRRALIIPFLNQFNIVFRYSKESRTWAESCAESYSTSAR
jgi:hypothetical protein